MPPGRTELRIRALAGAAADAPSTARDRLLARAVVRFYESGIRAVGIDPLIAEASIAKATFYRHFPSKADLVVAYVQRRSDAWLRWFDEAVDGRLDAVWDVLAEHHADDGFRGCAVVNAVAEVGAAVPGVVDAARRHAAASATSRSSRAAAVPTSSAPPGGSWSTPPPCARSGTTSPAPPAAGRPPSTSSSARRPEAGRPPP